MQSSIWRVNCPGRRPDHASKVAKCLAMVKDQIPKSPVVGNLKPVGGPHGRAIRKGENPSEWEVVSVDRRSRSAAATDKVWLSRNRWGLWIIVGTLSGTLQITRFRAAFTSENPINMRLESQAKRISAAMGTLFPGYKTRWLYHTPE